MKVTIIALILISFCSCGSSKTSDPYAFEDDLLGFMKNGFVLTDTKQSNVSFIDSLRSKLFYSKDLKKATRYSFDFKGRTMLFLTLYQYTKKDTSEAVILNIKKDKEIRLEEGFYGPLGKEFESFFSASNYVVHLEAICGKGIDEKQLIKITDSLCEIGGRHFEKTSNQIIKPCE